MKRHTPKEPPRCLLSTESGDIEEGVLLRIVDPITNASIVIQETDQDVYIPTGNGPGVLLEARKIVQFRFPLKTWATPELQKTFLSLWRQAKQSDIVTSTQAAQNLSNEVKSQLDEAFSRGGNKAALKVLRKGMRAGCKLKHQPVNDFRERKKTEIKNPLPIGRLVKEYQRVCKKYPYDGYRSICRMLKDKRIVNSTAKNLERVLRPHRIPRHIKRLKA